MDIFNKQNGDELLGDGSPLVVTQDGFVRAGRLKLFRLGADGHIHFWDKHARMEVAVAVADLLAVVAGKSTIMD